jgi:hypothetical protein
MPLALGFCDNNVYIVKKSIHYNMSVWFEVIHIIFIFRSNLIFLFVLLLIIIFMARLKRKFLKNVRTTSSKTSKSNSKKNLSLKLDDKSNILDKSIQKF